MVPESMNSDQAKNKVPTVPAHLKAAACPHSPTGPPNFVPAQRTNLPGLSLPVVEETKITLRPIAILIEELTKDDTQIRHNAMRQLHTIAKALGPYRTAKELIPYLTDMIDDEDEVLVVMCKELLKLIPWVGGPTNVHYLLKPYEVLCVVEETKTRDLAIEGAAKVLEQMPEERCEAEGFQMLKRLISSDWHTARVSGSQLAPYVYSRVGRITQGDIEKLFLALADDSIPMVRKAVVQAVAKFLPNLPQQILMDNFLPVFIQLCKDEQDGVRLFAVKTLAQFSEVFNPAQAAQWLLVCIRSVCLDTSWRVRYVAADDFIKLCDILGPVQTKERMLDIYGKLLRDEESEVRASAVAKCGDMCRRIGQELFLDKILPALNLLVTDPSKYTRASFADSAMVLFKPDCLTNEVATEKIIPLIIKLLKDDFPEVRLNVIKNLENASQSFKVEAFRQTLLPSIRELSTDANWRVRTGIIDLTPYLAKHLGHEFFEEIEPPPFTWLHDKVSQVRETAAQNLTRLGQIFGEVWVVEYLIPNLEKMASNNKKYLERIVVLDAIRHMMKETDIKIGSKLLKITLTLCTDEVPNVRLKAYDALEVFVRAKGFSNSDARGVQSALEKGVSDEDMDVAYRANEVLALLKEKESKS